MNNKYDHLAAPLWLLFGGREFLAGKAIELLREIDYHGSLSKAVHAVPMSYKSAWDLIDRLNNLSERPLVSTEIGGRSGGGTKLTDYGKSILKLYTSLENSYKTVFASMGSEKIDAEQFFKIFQGFCMKTSARNQLSGTVSKVVKGMINTEVAIKISEHESISAVITNDSLNELGLTTGSNVIVLIKASSVIVFPGICNIKCSAQNMLQGRIAEVRLGIVNGEVLVKLKSDKIVTAVITKESTENLKLSEGMDITVAFSSSHVILAIPM